jgi:predicted DsbA family dithiol-disulfide isomerase
MLEVDIWSDVVCPWCYIGKRRLESALARFPQREEVTVRWHAFELDPEAPAEATGTAAERLAEKYGTSLEQAQEIQAQMTALAAQEGLDFHFERARAANTFDAHRLLQLAGDRGVQTAAKERLMRAYFSEGERVGDRETLVRLGAEAGLDPEEARGMLASDAYGQAVRADEALAARLGIRGVPFFVLGRRFGVSGAQPADVLLEALEKAWDDSAASAAA